jgi:hypothetical protein
MSRALMRLDTLWPLLAHIRERLAFDVAFLPWDGPIVPANLGPSELASRLPTALVRRPNADTLQQSPGQCASRYSAMARVPILLHSG